MRKKWCPLLHLSEQQERFMRGEETKLLRKREWELTQKTAVGAWRFISLKWRAFQTSFQVFFVPLFLVSYWPWLWDQWFVPEIHGGTNSTWEEFGTLEDRLVFRPGGVDTLSLHHVFSASFWGMCLCQLFKSGLQGLMCKLLRASPRSIQDSYLIPLHCLLSFPKHRFCHSTPSWP